MNQSLSDLFMTDRLTESQLSQVIAEVQRLSDKRQEELDAGQMQQILTELSLPPELLDEAVIQVRRRKALENQQRRNRLIMGGVGAIAIFIMGGAVVLQQQWQQKLDRITAQQSRITLPRDDGNDRQSVNRQGAAELYYRVVLKDVPMGEKLSLSCDWVNPSNQTVKQNRYETQPITSAEWQTVCRYQINSNSPTGTWKVKMSLGDRTLSDRSFEVK
jgi:hypothetical protein